MGASTSSHARMLELEDNAIKQYVQDRWNSFKENCCIEDPNSYISINDLEALFASYMSKSQGDRDLFSIMFASDHIANLVEGDKFRLSSGSTIRLVLGLKVVNLDGFV